MQHVVPINETVVRVTAANSMPQGSLLLRRSAGLSWESARSRFRAEHLVRRHETVSVANSMPRRPTGFADCAQSCASRGRFFRAEHLVRRDEIALRVSLAKSMSRRPTRFAACVARGRFFRAENLVRLHETVMRVVVASSMPHESTGSRRSCAQSSLDGRSPSTRRDFGRTARVLLGGAAS